ncbi:MAG: hypothetical protein MHM6MM_002896 [Cercozoa sp. M6MM]
MALHLLFVALAASGLLIPLLYFASHLRLSQATRRKVFDTSSSTATLRDFGPESLVFPSDTVRQSGASVAADLTLPTVISDPIACTYFIKYCHRSHTEELPLFLRDVASFLRLRARLIALLKCYDNRQVESVPTVLPDKRLTPGSRSSEENCRVRIQARSTEVLGEFSTSTAVSIASNRNQSPQSKYVTLACLLICTLTLICEKIKSTYFYSGSERELNLSSPMRRLSASHVDRVQANFVRVFGRNPSAELVTSLVAKILMPMTSVPRTRADFVSGICRNFCNLDSSTKYSLVPPSRLFESAQKEEINECSRSGTADAMGV